MRADDGDHKSYGSSAEQLRQYEEAFTSFLLLLDLLRKLDIISGVEYSKFDSMTYVDRNWGRRPYGDDN